MLKKLKLTSTLDEEDLLQYLLDRHKSSGKLAQMGIYPQTCTLQAMTHDPESNQVHFHITAVAPDTLLDLNDQIEELNKRVAARVESEARGSPVPLRGHKKFPGKT